MKISFFLINVCNDLNERIYRRNKTNITSLVLEQNESFLFCRVLEEQYERKS